MIERIRDPLNLLTFLLVGLGAAAWLFTNHLRIGPAAPERDELVVEFEQSPGIAPGFPVTYLGVQIGLTGESRLVADEVRGQGLVEIDIGIDPGQDVPDNVRAAVRRRSAVGEPYLDLWLPDGVTASTAALADGDRIPLERSDLPPSYEALFRTVEDVLSHIDTDDLNILMRETAIGLDGRAQDVRETVDNLASATANLADNAELLDTFVAEITTTTGILADASPQLEAGTDDLTLLVAALSQSRADIAALIDRTPALLGRGTGVLQASRPAIECLLPEVATLVGAFDEEVGRQIAAAVATAPGVPPIIDSVTDDRPAGPFVRLLGVEALGAPAGLLFDEPLPPPVPPPIERCPRGAVAADGSAVGPPVLVGAGAARPATSGTTATGAGTVLAAQVTTAMPVTGSAHLAPLVGLAAMLAAGLLTRTRGPLPATRRSRPATRRSRPAHEATLPHDRR